MNALIAWAVTHARTVLLFLLLILVTGSMAWVVAPKEAAPEIDIPIFFVSVPYPGISPEDAERLMVQPLERELQGLPGVDEMQSWAGEGFALLRIDFEPGWDNRQALSDLREEVDLVRPELPDGAEEPSVSEVDLSLFPVVTVNLSGPLEERTLVRLARELRDRVEALPGVLEADIGGDREEQMEVLVDPLVLETYELSFGDLSRAIERNNRLVAAGAVDTGVGRIPLRVPGTIDDIDDVLDTAVRVENDTVVRVRDVAEVRRSYRDPEGFTRIDGQPSVSLEIRKQTDANILEVVSAARATIEASRAEWPDSLEVTYTQDQAKDVADLLGDLENNVITAVLIVALVILVMMGGRAALLVGLAIPGAFLGGILAIHLLGFTLNIVVLFALILVVGMLVDGAVVVVELADRYIAEGRGRVEAFRAAAQRMAWPITAAIATTLAVFAPMLFWPGMVGEFIVYLPATVIVTLIASLAMALVFIPVLGSVIGPSRPINAEQTRFVRAAEEGRFAELHGITARYIRILRPLVDRPGLTLGATVGLLVLAYAAYASFGRGVEFFPSIEPENVQVQVQARGDLSVREADALVRQVEGRLMASPEVKHAYARTLGTQLARLQGDYPQDVVGVIQLELTHWRTRPPAEAVIAELRERTADLPGLRLQFRAQEHGPGEGRPIRIVASGEQPGRIPPVIREIRAQMDELGGFEDIGDDLPLPGVELEVRFDREQAARFGVDVPLLGDGVQLLTDGILLGSWRPDFTDEEVDIRLRLPAEQRHLQQLANLNLPAPGGLVPLANFAELVPVPATGLIKRLDGQRAYTIEADAAPGYLVDERVRALQARLDTLELDDAVEIRFRGEAEEQEEAARFLLGAFAMSLFLMLAMMVTQFNRFSQALLVMSAIVFSTAGVLLALLARGEPFGIVMSGIGVLALAGIVVNNNIVLIDNYNEQRGRGLTAHEAALRAAAQRMRPVLLTAITTILGLLPMVLAWTVDFAGRDFYIGAPVTGFWIQLATAIAGGLLFATPLTLLFTPAMLVLLDRMRGRYESLRVSMRPGNSSEP
ncbi:MULTISPECIES: efflux RND transporter permease subunit [Thioalkalivibrio]|uniref:MFS transporter n=1 Tax=Thioalkalivibrio halophilus TaxID=252474 RepID=A0A1V2ZXE3_9GAMM|nr:MULTISPECIES: efflux RND transporter permease subunit [Thioalkalivibrio]OOC09503.1 MFS transporter [Thioalkalivibrio halophilus]PYG02779.1 multidrug efflux pump [Thioalkalivibrio sp. ALE21]